MSTTGQTATARLLIAAPDRPGLVSAVAGFVAAHGGNIVDADQHTDDEAGMFFQRVAFELEGFDLGRERLPAELRSITEPLGMHWQLRFSDEARRIAVLGSTQLHCVYDLLSRAATGDLPADIAFVASNHTDCQEAAERFAIPFHHLPVGPDNRAEQEAQLADLAEASGVDLLVLARYMQILSPSLVDRFPSRIINIHHSFLPAFVGGRPYHQAHERGVKVIGATAHYVTAE
ncbi:MAG: formyltetrahydrofolate deformylase, partial [Acidimicrobiales bacterium]|nr:formyltetrahydrofolate deformylase [Acidimicrobiales bacterium]